MMDIWALRVTLQMECRVRELALFNLGMGTAHCASGSHPALAPLPTILLVGKIDNMPAELITRFKNITPDGGIIELVVWRVPQPVPPSSHGFKYRAVYALNGQRVIGFDNERGKGDHCHIQGVELPYAFTTVDQLVEDFIAAVDAARSTT